MAGPTAEQLAERAFNLGLLTDAQRTQLLSELGIRDVGPEEFAQLVVRREFMTNYQTERLLRGEKSGFFFGDYKALYFVGSGSFARVYRAVHRETGQIVAVKVLRRKYSESPATYEPFIREGEVGRTLRHPNVVPIYEVHSLDKEKLHFLVMEFVEGRNLREHVRVRGKLDAMEATRMAAGICRGLDYAFQRGLTHRDLKLSNVLVSSRGDAKLVDFGLAGIDETAGNEAVGENPNARTIDYAALERATGVRKDDTRSDIYFLGCVYYHMLSGRPPLVETRDRVQRLSKQRLTEVPAIRDVEPSVPSAVAMVVGKAMSLDADKRYQTPGAMLIDIEALLKRLAEGTASEEESEPDRQQRERAAAVLEVRQKRGQQAVMVVESNARMQDILRDGLKRAGFRVLVTSDPRRALERFWGGEKAADCIIFNAQDLGQPALAAFNQLADDTRSAAMPAILLLDEPQQAWRTKAKLGDHRLVLSMPITMKELRVALLQLLPDGGGQAVAAPSVEEPPSVVHAARLD
jgi:serine/threonine-protein kinase